MNVGEKNEKVIWLILPQANIKSSVLLRTHHLIKGFVRQNFRVICIDIGKSFYGKIKQGLNYWNVKKDKNRYRDITNIMDEWLEGAIILRPSLPPFAPLVYLPAFIQQIFFRLLLLEKIYKYTNLQNHLIILCEHPTFYPLIQMIRMSFPKNTLVYSMADDIPEFQESIYIKKKLKIWQERLIRESDKVISVNPFLVEKYLSKKDKPFLILPNGLSVDLMNRVKCEEFYRLKELSHPVIGFVGAITKILYWDILFKLVKEHPIWSFVFAGKVDKDVIDKWNYLKNFQNVYYYGIVPYSSLGSLIQNFDVGLILFASTSELVRELDPLKLKEYLAFGVPVVSINKLAFSEKSFGVVWEVSSYLELEKAICEAYNLRYDSSLIEIRRNVVKEFDWNNLVKKLIDFVID